MPIDKKLLNSVYSMMNKTAFAPPMAADPAAAGMPPMDPAMMGGAMPPPPPPPPPGAAPMPMDPAMMGGMPPPAPAPAPTDPAMAAGVPMDPAMMGMPPVDPAMAGGMPPAGAPGEIPPGMPVMLTIDDLRAVMQETKGSGSTERLDKMEEMMRAIMGKLGLALPDGDMESVGPDTAPKDSNFPEENSNLLTPEAEQVQNSAPPAPDPMASVQKTASETVSTRDLWHRDLESRRDPILKTLQYLKMYR